MIRLPAIILVGCVVGAALILVEFGFVGGDHRLSLGARPTPAKIAPAAPEIRGLSGPLARPTQGRPANDTDSPLRGVRLSGVAIGPDFRIAIFAVTGANPRVLSEGDALKGWRIESIRPERVVLGGPAGSMVLEPQPDATLVRRPLPVAAQPDQPAAAMADTPAQPIAVTPIAVATVSTAAPVQTQGYPYYSPEYEPDPWAWGNPWGWGWPVGVAVGFGGCWNCGLHGRFFHPGFRRFGIGHPRFFHPGFGRLGFAHARFAGGFHGGARR
jgi:hypothetical protein